MAGGTRCWRYFEVPRCLKSEQVNEGNNCLLLDAFLLLNKVVVHGICREDRLQELDDLFVRTYPSYSPRPSSRAYFREGRIVSYVSDERPCIPTHL